MKNTKLIEHFITSGKNTGKDNSSNGEPERPAGYFMGGPERSGYWMYCLHNGQVVGRIFNFKQRTNRYRIEPAPDLTQARAVPMPFDNCTNIVWKLLVGEGDRQYLIEAKADNCLNYWAYVKALTYSLLLIETNNTASTIAMLTNHRSQNAGKPGQYFVSSDLQNWQEIPLKEAKEDLLLFSIPTSFQGAEKIYFKFTPSGEASVAGFALLS